MLNLTIAADFVALRSAVARLRSSSVTVDDIESAQALRATAPIGSAARATLDSAITTALIRSPARKPRQLRGAALRSQRRARNRRIAIAGMVAAYAVAIPVAAFIGFALAPVFAPDHSARYALTATIEGQVYVADTGLTGEDCAGALRMTGAVQVNETDFVPVDRSQLACEFQP